MTTGGGARAYTLQLRALARHDDDAAPPQHPACCDGKTCRYKYNMLLYRSKRNGYHGMTVALLTRSQWRLTDVKPSQNKHEEQQRALISASHPSAAFCILKLKLRTVYYNMFNDCFVGTTTHRDLFSC